MLCRDVKNEFVRWTLLMLVIALPSSMLSQVSRLGETDAPCLSVRQIIPPHRAVCVESRRGAGIGETVYPVLVDIKKTRGSVYPSGPR